jgi:predicted dehydrogenase
VTAPGHIGVGMLGYGFMGRAHSHAFTTIATMTDAPLVADLVAIAGRDADAVRAVADRFGYDDAVSDWRALVADPRVGLFDNSGPNDLHAEPTIAAAEAGKHVVCEKPIGRDADEAYAVWQRVAATGVVHLCAFNYRFVPAVRLAREMIAAGEIGEIRHFRGHYLQEWLVDPAAPASWRLDRARAGSGALGDLGAHVVDVARYLVGEIANVSGVLRTFVPQRDADPVTVDDAFAATVAFAGGAIGTVEASRVAAGRKNSFRWEVNGTRGSLSFDMERLNELHVSDGTGGFRRRLVTEPDDPYVGFWWPPGHTLGWDQTFVHELHHLLTAIATGGGVGPHGADFEDGYRAAEVLDAIALADAEGGRVAITYRT